MAEYEVVAVAQSPRAWTGKGGEMLSYRMTLRNGDGRELGNVEWARKATSPAPAVGQKLVGAIDTTGQHGPKYKPEQQQQGGGGGWKPRPPEENAMIVRQHSQTAALKVLELRLQRNVLTEEDLLPDHITRLIDFFDDDVKAGVRRALAQT